MRAPVTQHTRNEKAQKTRRDKTPTDHERLRGAGENLPYFRGLTYCLAACLAACQTFCLLTQKSSGERPPRRRRPVLSLPVVSSPRGGVLPLVACPAVSRPRHSVLRPVVAPQGEYLESRLSDWSDPSHCAVQLPILPKVAAKSCFQKVAAKNCH